jgi:DNA-binding CsgD family transcriptional regulator
VVEETAGLVVFGDVIGSREDSAGAAAWLRDLVAELDEAYGARRLAPFGFTQGDELQGLLRREADPLEAVLRAALAPGMRPMRWVVVRGAVDPGEGPATQRSGRAFLDARRTIEQARAAHERLVIVGGEPSADELLADLAPVLADLLGGLTPRQRYVARLALVEGLRQAAVAEKLGVRRATVSVSFARARIHSMSRLASAIRRALGIAPATE